MDGWADGDEREWLPLTDSHTIVISKVVLSKVVLSKVVLSNDVLSNVVISKVVPLTTFTHMGWRDH